MSYKHVVLADLKDAFKRMEYYPESNFKGIPNHVTYAMGFLHGNQYHMFNSHIVRDLLKEDKRNIVQEVTNIMSDSSDFVVEDYEKEHKVDGQMRINQIISLKISCFLRQQHVREVFGKLEAYDHPEGELKPISNYTTYTWGFLRGIEFHRSSSWVFVNLSDEDKKSLLIDVVKMSSESFYFTFETSEDFPFKDGYLIIYAADLSAAYQEFNRLYPNEENPDLLNCSEVYSKEEWSKLGLFKGKEPFNEIIAFEFGF